MRICIITPYYLPVKGGITSYVLNLAESLKTGKNVISIIARKGGNKDNTVYAINRKKRIFVLKTFLVLWEIKPDVIHSHAHWYTLAPGIIYKFFNPKTIVVHTFHTDPLDNMKGLKKRMFELLLSKCNAVTFASAFLMKKIEKNLKISTKKHVIYAGVSKHDVESKDLEKFKEKYSLKNSKPILAFVGGLVWKKKVEGVKRLIKAFRYVTKEFPNAKLLVIGGGEYRKDVELLVKKIGIENNVVFTGFIDNVSVPLLVSDIYAHITLQEGFPIALLEAMSLGKPVIASRTGGMPEVIINGENGILVDSKPEQIANAILDLYNDEETQTKLADNAKKTVENNFSWSKIASEFLILYKN